MDKNRSNNAHSKVGKKINITSPGQQYLHVRNIDPDVSMLASALYSTQTLSQPADFTSWDKQQQMDTDRWGTERTNMMSWWTAASTALVWQEFVYIFLGSRENYSFKE